ncbi:MAG: fibronectin type III domain-containing protein [Candidatus Peribacteraceae bacterium]|nr:fibronectin type III domain-containing protein [Candidatus Peribacteraceae bacterium]
MRLSPLLAGITLAMSMTGSALAAQPPGITGLRAEIQDDSRAVLRWDPVAGDIAYYRVYYSTTSILEHRGEYDDFDQTAGPLPEYTLEGILPGEDLYVAVMAVNVAGEESEFFSEEVRISDVGNAASSIPSALPIQEPAAEEEDGTETAPRPLELLSVTAVSPTEIRLTLSEPLQIRTKNAQSAFVIRQTEGGQLEILSVTVDGTTIVLTTNEQMPGAVYELRVADTLTKQTGLYIDAASRVSLFAGYSSAGENPVAASSAPSFATSTGSTPLQEGILPSDSAVPNIRGLVLQTIQTADGLYSVKAEWDPASVSSQIVFLVIGQSFDKGATIVYPHLVPANALSATVAGVPAGMFGVFVQAMDAQGRVAPGVFESVLLGAEALPQVASAPTAQIAPVETLPVLSSQEVIPALQPERLPQSGTAVLLGLFAVMGATLGWRKLKRKTPQASR